MTGAKQSNTIEIHRWEHFFGSKQNAGTRKYLTRFFFTESCKSFYRKGYSSILNEIPADNV